MHLSFWTDFRLSQLTHSFLISTRVSSNFPLSRVQDMRHCGLPLESQPQSTLSLQGSYRATYSCRAPMHSTLLPGRGKEQEHKLNTAVEQTRCPVCYVITGVSGSGKRSVICMHHAKSLPEVSIFMPTTFVCSSRTTSLSLSRSMFTWVDVS